MVGTKPTVAPALRARAERSAMSAGEEMVSTIGAGFRTG